MPVSDTSRDAYRTQTEVNTSQERELFVWMRRNGPVTDRQIAAHFGWSPAHASARRNGVAKKLMGSKSRVYKAGKTKDAKTGKRVILWGIMTQENKQGALF
jgi:hypothetical protein